MDIHFLVFGDVAVVPIAPRNSAKSDGLCTIQDEKENNRILFPKQITNHGYPFFRNQISKGASPNRDAPFPILIRPGPGSSSDPPGSGSGAHGRDP